MIVTGSSDSTVRIWNPKIGDCVHVFRGQDFHEGPICSVVCHPTQPLMLSCSQDGTARLLHIQQKRQLALLSHDSPSQHNGLDQYHPSSLANEAAGEAGATTAVQSVEWYDEIDVDDI
jgi:WD40 repeat protein